MREIIFLLLIIIITSKKIPLCTVPDPIQTLTLSASNNITFGAYSPDNGVIGTWNNPSIGDTASITVSGWPSRSNIVLRI